MGEYCTSGGCIFTSLKDECKYSLHKCNIPYYMETSVIRDLFYIPISMVQAYNYTKCSTQYVFMQLSIYAPLKTGQCIRIVLLSRVTGSLYKKMTKKLVQFFCGDVQNVALFLQ